MFGEVQLIEDIKKVHTNFTIY